MGLDLEGTARNISPLQYVGEVSGRAYSNTLRWNVLPGTFECSTVSESDIAA